MIGNPVDEIFDDALYGKDYSSKSLLHAKKFYTALPMFLEKPAIWVRDGGGVTISNNWIQLTWQHRGEDILELTVLNDGKKTLHNTSDVSERVNFKSVTLSDEALKMLLAL